MKIQNNKTRITGTITAALMIGLIMLSPMTILPNVNASSIPSNVVSTQPPLPPQAILLQSKISEMVGLHPGWIGMLSWNKTSATIDYLGPADKSPFLTKTIYNPWSGLASFGGQNKVLGDPQTLNVDDSVNQASGAGGTAIKKEQASYNLVKSTDGTVNSFQILDAMNSNNQKWIQVGTLYDNNAQIATPAGWYIIYQVWPIDSTCGSDAPIVNQHSVRMTTWGANDPIQSYISGTSTGGQYTLSALDTLALTGSSITASISGDTGTNTINLGEQNPIFSSCFYPSAAQVEQWATGTHTYHFVSDQYSYIFTLTSGSTTTGATGFHGKDSVSFPSAVTVSSTNSPASDTFSYP